MACFWPDAAVNNGSLGRRCDSFSVDPVTMKADAFSQVKPMSFTFVPANTGLHATPLIFTSPNVDKTQKILDRAYKDPFTDDDMTSSAKYTLDAMWTLLMLLGLGCGGVEKIMNGTSFLSSKITPSGFSSESRSAVCKLLQHGNAPEKLMPCCLDLSSAGNIQTWTDAEGTMTVSGTGLAHAQQLLAKLSDQEMSNEYFSASADAQSSGSFEYVQKSRDDWWNWDVTKHFGECLCLKEVEGEMTGQECEELFGPGCDENNPKKCQKDKNCKCKMNV